MGISHRLDIVTNARELSLVLRAAAVTARIPFLLKRHDIGEVVERLTPESPGGFEGGLTQDRAVHLSRRVLRTFARLGYKANCLRRSLLLYNGLRFYGVPVDINFGVKPGDDGLLGHCWLTLDGRLLYDREDEVAKFAHMFTLPNSRTVDAPGASSDEPEMTLRNISFDG